MANTRRDIAVTVLYRGGGQEGRTSRASNGDRMRNDIKFK